MKLLLTSDFKVVGKNYLDRFFDNLKGKTCLFVGYACEEDAEMLDSPAKDIFKDLGCRVVDLLPDYDFSDKVDIIYVRGGNTTKLIHYLRQFGQYERIADLVENHGALYIGVSAGSVLAGNDTEWTLRTEPYPVDLKALYGKDALKGYNWINKMVFVHDSKFRFAYDDELQADGKLYRLRNTEIYKEIKEDKKLFLPKSYISLGNNQVLIEKDGKRTLETYDWSNIPIMQ